MREELASEGLGGTTAAWRDARDVRRFSADLHDANVTTIYELGTRRDSPEQGREPHRNKQTEGETKQEGADGIEKREWEGGKQSRMELKHASGETQSKSRVREQASGRTPSEERGR